MNTNKAIKILEALASGCSPTTGEVIQHETILNERDVIRALQLAIDQLKSGIPKENFDIEISNNEVNRAIQLFREAERAPTSNNLTEFFLGTTQFQHTNIVSHELYGKYRNRYSKGLLLDFLEQYLVVNNLPNKTNSENEPYRKIDFFQKEKFNRLNNEDIIRLKERINKIGILKNDNLSEYVQNARKNYPRAYEAWSEEEKQLLGSAITFTNDLDLLSECFQRGHGSIESYGQRLIYDSLNASK